MARKRGGLAGLYDRNKGVLQALAPMAAGAIGGPLAGAAVGAAMRGLDRPGQSGIGFDLVEGLKGGASGYMAGQTGQALKGGIKNLLTARKVNALGDKISAVGGGDFAGLDIPDINLQRSVFDGMSGGTGGFDATSYLADSAAQGPSAAMRLGRGVSTANPTAARQVAASVPNRIAPPQPTMTNMTPSLSQVGSGTYGGTRVDPSAMITNQPNQPMGRFAAPTSAPNAAPPSSTPWWKSKEGMMAIGQGAQAAAGLAGSQGQLALEREQMERAQQEAEARARLMAMFAPSILAGFNAPYGGQYTGLGGR
jgi:hypothetical protein